MNKYKLLTPGPLTTTDTVKAEMLVDHCTWDDEYKAITQDIREKLLALAGVSSPEYTTVLMQGSGSFGVESVITSSVSSENKILIIANGAYGMRMVDICQHAGLQYILYLVDNRKRPDLDEIKRLIKESSDLTHIAMVHCETTSGILNDIEGVGKIAKSEGLIFIADCMSSFGGVEIPITKWNIDFLISSANKCIQGVPGFSFIISRTSALSACENQAPSLALDLYDQWKTMNVDGKWRFTSPTHVVLAFRQALAELEEEGGIKARNKRYEENQRLISEKLNAIGFKPYLDKSIQSPIITTFSYPKGYNFTFREMYDYIKERGFVLYPGKVMEADTFRVGNIGEIYPEDIEKLSKIMSDFLNSRAYGKWGLE